MSINSYDISSFAGLSALSGIIPILSWTFGVFGLLTIIAMWKIYKKLGIPGWASIVPIYNLWVLFEAVDLQGWLSLLPVANVIALLVAYFRLAKKFNKGTGFGLGLVFLNFIFILILGFGKDTVEQKDFASGPDLMATDPNNNGNLNLMTPDPVATIPDAPVAPVVESIAEEPSLENQMTIETPVTPVTPVMEAAPTIVTPEPIVNKEVPVIDAFSMNAPVMPEAPTPVAPVEVPSTPEILAPELSNVDIPVAPNVEPLKIDQISTPESPTMEIPKIVSETEVPIMQTKKCPNCGYENANTVKACLKCGKLLD